LPLDLNILGEGVYTPREAARLIGATPQDVRRWTRGSGATEPLWHAYYQPIEDAAEVSFADVIELRVVKSFRKANISLQAIRFAIRFAQEKYGIDRPLSSLGFKTDGGEILMNAVERDGYYVSLSKKRPGQKVFSDIVMQSLVDLEYADERIARWRPSFARGVVIDPERFFGDPILDKYGISTKVIADEYNNFQDRKYLSGIYEIPIKEIDKAIKFEKYLDLEGTNVNGKGLI